MTTTAPTTTEAPPTPTSHYTLAVLAMGLGGFAIGTTEFVTMGLLPEIADLTRQVVGTRARIGTPRRLAGLGDSLGGPAFAAAVGLAQWGLARQQPAPATRRDARGSANRRRSSGGLTGWLRELLP